MVDTTPNLGLNYIYSNQAQKEISVNEAFTTLDAVWNNGAISKAIATPPVSPNLADLYIVGTSPTGAWAGKAKNLAYYNNGWKFIAPKEGITIWVNDEDAQYTYSGIDWVSSSGGLASVTTDGITIEGNGTSGNAVRLKEIQPKIGINTSADSTNKLAVASEAILFNHNGAGTQVKLNKNSATDNASFLYQTNFSGRAEIGLTGDDDFHFKVSPNGTSWNDSIIIDKTSGNVSLNSHRITSLANPTAAQDAATKAYVDANIGSTDWGAITGTLSSQTDLNTELDAKVNDTGDILNGAYDNSATLKQDFAKKYVAVASGNTTTIGCYVRCSAAPDTVYNGNRPRLMLKKNPSLGVDNDVVLATATVAANGAWELISGTTPSASANGSWEVYVDCDGTAGWVNCNDFEVS
jgi:hypothetical protein